MDKVVAGEESSSKSTTAARLPRWTRQEILVLIQGKRVAESRVGRARGSSSGGAHESKWAAVSSYCKRHGVNRGPVQCRKRWSNLSGDFRKIKVWEASDETESYWAMRNDLRREEKLPGFFDREVYDILDGGGGADVSAEEYDGLVRPGGSPEKAEPDPAPVMVEEQQDKAVSQNQEPPAQGSDHDHNHSHDEEVQHVEEGKKRKRFETKDVGEEAVVSDQHRLIEALEKNGRLFRSYIEAHNTHLQLDREQRKEQSNTIVMLLNKLVDTLGRIADKL